MSEYLIHRYEHNQFRGWCVTTKRAGKRFVRYFSDRPNGRNASLRAARNFRDELVLALPKPMKIKRKCIRNTTGVVGVSRLKERKRAGRPFVRYVASWPKGNGKKGKTSFSVALYGEAEAFRLARQAREAGVLRFLRARD